jgi:predicted dehydrogenase
MDIPTMKVRYYSDKNKASWLKAFEESIVAIERQDPLDAQLKRFAEVIQGKESPLVTVIDGYRNLAVVEAIQRAGSTGGTEKVAF